MTIIFNRTTGSVGVDLSRNERRRQRLKRRRWERRQQRRFQTLRAHTYRALSRLTVRNWSRIAHVSNENTLGHITSRQMWRELYKVYTVRARLGR